MGKQESVREILERVVSDRLAAHFTTLQKEVVEQASQQLASAPAGAGAPGTPPGGAPTDLLNAALSSVLDSSLQADILGALVEGAGKFAERVALFVIRAGAASGWRARGLEGNEAIKNFTIDINRGLAGRALQDRVSASASAAEFDANFVASFGAPAEGTNALVLPLVIRDKVPALLYADCGPAPGGKLDPSALECLVRAAGLWLEVVAARKAGLSPADNGTGTEKLAAMAAPPPAPEPAAAPSHAVEPPPPVAVRAVAAASVTAVAAAPAPVPPPVATAPAMSPEDEEVHKKAKRFAKLLVDEIKLYNKAKVEEGRAHKDIYARLKDDIDKSHAAYDKRYSQSVATSADYFTQELVRILCDGDRSLLGSGFPR